MKRKIFVVIALVLVASLALTACGGGIAPASQAPASEPAAPASEPAAPASEPAAPASEPAAPASEPAAASGDVVELKLTHHDAPESATGKFLDAWAKKILDASGGRLKINVFPGGSLAAPKDAYDMCANGTVDMAWGLQGFYPGKFPMTEAVMLPMLGITSASQGSRIVWDLYSNTDLLKKEYEETHVLLLHTNCDSPISTKSKEITKIDDLKGLKIRANAGPPTVFLKQASAQPVAMVIGEIYSSLEKGVLDGVITDWHGIRGFKLDEQLKYYLDAHIQVSTYFLVINNDKYASLPEDLKKILDENSGDAALDLAGGTWDDVQTEMIQKCNTDGKKVYTLNEEETAKLQDLGKKTEEEWIKEYSDKGIDVKPALEKVKELVPKYAK